MVGVSSANGHDSYGDQASLHPNVFRYQLVVRLVGHPRDLGAVLDHGALPHSVQAAICFRPMSALERITDSTQKSR